MATVSHMRQSDAFAWYMERDPLLRSTVVAVLVLDRAPDREVVGDRVDRASRTVPGLRHRVVESPLRLSPPEWVVDPDFDLEWHVRWIEAPAPKDLRFVLDFARTAGMTAFDPARPLWEWTTIEGLEGGRAACVLKIHHSLTDGVGGMALATSLLDLEPEPPDRGPLPEAPVTVLRSGMAPLLDAVRYTASRAAELGQRAAGGAWSTMGRAVRNPAGTCREVVGTAGSIGRMMAPILDTRSPVMRSRRLGWHYDVLEVPVQGLRHSGRAAGGTVNDAFLAAIVGGLRMYHERHDAPVAELRVTMPISIRTAADPAGGNRITLLRFAVPETIDDPVARMRRMHELATGARAEPAVPYTNEVAAAFNLLPPQFVGGMLKHVDFLASNVPGLDAPLYMGGARVTALYPFGPTIGAALNVTLLSYCGACGMGVNTDTGAVADPDTMLDCLAEGFREILAVGGSDTTVAFPGRRT